MTDKDFQGKIAVRPDALRKDLETTDIKAGHAAETLWRAINECRSVFYAVGVTLPGASDASDATLTTIAEVDEILSNLKVRICAEQPTVTALQRHANSR